MTFNHQEYVARYVNNIQAGGEPLNDAAAYDVRMVSANNVAAGETYWRIIGIHHLLPDENAGKHHVYLEALDENGQRIKNPFAWAGWTWEGRQPDQRADPVPLDKPDHEPAGNIAMYFNQTVTAWINGLSAGAHDKSDKAENLHTRHPDEGTGNTLGHHSFYVVFQRTRKETPVVADGVITGTVENGLGHTIQLRREEQIVAERVIGSDLAYRFDNLEYGTYSVVVLGTGVGRDNIKIDENNNVATVNLKLPPPTQSALYGRVENGVGKTLLLLKAGTTLSSLVVPESTQYRFENLGAGIYSLQVADTAVRADNIVLDGTNSREVNLVVPEEPEQTKCINHYLLYGPPDTPGRQTNLLLATNYILTFSVTAGYSVEEAKQARYVTIIGEGISPEEVDAIKDSESRVEVLAGNSYNIEAELNRRIEIGVPFPRPDLA